MKTHNLLLILVALAVPLAGCADEAASPPTSTPAGGSPTPSPTPSAATTPARLDLIARDFAIEGPREVKAGLYEVTLTNEGTEFHHAVFYKLSAGRTAGELADALVDGKADAPAWATPVGGPNVALPGAPTTTFVLLEAGEYAIACIIPSMDHELHVGKGMVAALTVTPNEQAPAAPPAHDATVTLDDYKFEVAGEIEAGENVLRVVNGGAENHEIVIFELFGNATTMEFLEILEGGGAEPPGRAVSGTTPLAPGKEAWVEATFTPGRYTFVCFDVAGTHHPHFLDGMVYEFEVA